MRPRPRFLVGEHVDVMHAQRVERRHGTSGGRAKADDHGAQPTPVVAGGSRDLHGVEHGAVAGKLVVLVEHVQAEGTVAFQWFIASNAISVSFRSMATCVSSSSCTQCGHPPENLPDAHLGDVTSSGLGCRMTSHSSTSCSRV